MAGILTNDLEEIIDPKKTPLVVEECLAEFNEGQKALARDNLDVYDRASVYNRQDLNIKLDETIKKAFEKYLNEDDPHGILPIVNQMISDFTKIDGSTPFIAPQTGVDPVQDFHLTTKRFVTKILKDHITEKDPHHILPEIENVLEEYVRQSETYFKDQLYTKNEIDKQSGKYIKKDGTTPFTKAQVGADPQIDSHLATKRYVDKVIYNHLVDIDPHGFIEILNQRLASYAKASNVYDKAQTYSRVQIDSIIRGLVREAAKEVLNDHLNSFDPHNILAEVRKERYVKQDGTIPFRAPQKGVDAVGPQDLVTLHQVEEKIQDKEILWVTSGPVETTVGFVEDNQDIPETMTFQEIMDAIFYGKQISLTVPKYVTIGDTAEIIVCIHGSIGLIESAVLYQGESPIHTFEKSDFQNGCVTVNSDTVNENTEFTFRVIYSNNTVLEDSETVQCSYPIFVGLLPKWKFGNTVTFDYLKELSSEDNVNNRFINGIPSSITQKYDFRDSSLKHIFVVIPENYPDLETMVTKSQSFEIEAFDVIDMIPLQVSGKDIIYKMYIYRQALSSLNQEITFNFKK